MILLPFAPFALKTKLASSRFTFNTWGDNEDDYIKDVFDDWLADPRGEFTAAVIDGEVVGIAKLTDMGDDEWWFEGLRIDPAYRRQGIAASLSRYHVDLAKRLGGKVIRYMTGGGNVGSQAIGARAGFEHIITYTAYLADASREFALPALLTTDDVPALAALDRFAVDALSARRLSRGVVGQDADGGRDCAGRLNRISVYGLKDEAGQVAAWALLRSR